MRKRFLAALLSIAVLFSATTLYSLPTTNAPSITFAWSPSTSTNFVLGGYNLYYGPAVRTYTNSINVGKINQYTVTLGRGIQYYFAVTVFDTNNIESDYSSEVAYKTGTVPAPPATFTFTVVTP